MTAKKEKIKEQDAAPVQRVRNDLNALREKFSVGAVIGNIPYLAFVALLCVLYIAYNQKAVSTQRALNKKHSELKELRWEYMDVKSQMVYAQMETEVIKRGAKIGLKPMLLPAYVISEDTVRTNSSN